MNKNMLSPVGFKFGINRLPEFSAFVQSVTLPGPNLGIAEVPSPFKVIPLAGEHLTYGEIDVSFKINEDMGNYIEIFNWMTGLGFPDSYNQYKDFADDSGPGTGKGDFSDAVLMVYTSSFNAGVKIQIRDLFPVSLSPITFTSQDTSIEYIEATCGFTFLNYTFTEL
jgi:hypothetical protein